MSTKSRIDVKKTYKLYINGAFPRSESGRVYEVKNSKGEFIANPSLASRKDLRDAVTAARGAFGKWSGSTAYLRGQIIYRIAEMLEGRKEQFEAELKAIGDKTKITLRFRGREMAHQEIGAKMLDRLKLDLEPYGQVEQFPKMEGRQMVMVLAPAKKK